MSDRKLMDFSFDVRREPEIKLGEALINGALKLLEWLVLGILTLGIASIILQIIDNGRRK